MDTKEEQKETEIDEKCGVKSGPEEEEQVKKEVMPASDKFDKAKGSVIGACMGDAAGSILEFVHVKITEFGVNRCFEFPGGGLHNTAPAQITDDGELTMSLAKGLIAGKGVFNLHEIIVQYGLWIKSHPFDIGNTTRNSLGGTTSPYDGIVKKIRDTVEKKNKKSESNGCLMRCTPIGVWGHKLSDMDIFTAGKLDAGLTHIRDEPLQACGLYVLAIKHLINGDTRSQAYDKIKEFATVQKLTIRFWIQIVDNNKTIQEIDVKKKCGWVKIAFCFAMHYLKHQIDINEALRDMLSRGGDTDTNACIVAGLLGAYHGYSNIPAKWKENYNDPKKVKDLKSIVRLVNYKLLPQIYAEGYVEKLLEIAPDSFEVSQSPQKGKKI